MKTILGFVTLLAVLSAPVAWAIPLSLPLPTSAPVAATGPAAPEAPAVATVGEVEIRVLSANVDLIELNPKAGTHGEAGTSEQKLLTVKIELRNTGKADVAYRTYNGAPQGRDDRAGLVRNGSRQVMTLADFGGYEPAGITRETTLKAGQTITDVIPFLPPASVGEVRYTLYLPAKNLGGKGKPVLLAVTLPGA